jgi:hypothetical protein
MSPEAADKFFEMLKALQPGWIFAIIVGSILAYRSPQILKELFAGVRGISNGPRSKKNRDL